MQCQEKMIFPVPVQYQRNISAVPGGNGLREAAKHPVLDVLVSGPPRGQEQRPAERRQGAAGRGTAQWSSQGMKAWHCFARQGAPARSQAAGRRC